MSKPNLTNFQSKFLKFDSLMQARVKQVLLVSSPYDSFVLEEDGRLTELIYNEYLELNLSATPNVKRASNSEEALDILMKQDIDLVIVFKRVGDLDVAGFGHDVKSVKPDMPVVWNQISQAGVIVEAAYGDFAPDPSFGTHFFHNLTSFRIGYMTINAAIGNGFIEWDWFSSQPTSDETEFVRHVVLSEPLEVRIDGHSGAGLILKP